MAGMAVFVNRWGYGVHDIMEPLWYKAGLSFREALRIAHGPNPWRRDEGKISSDDIARSDIGFSREIYWLWDEGKANAWAVKIKAKTNNDARYGRDRARDFEGDDGRMLYAVAKP